MISRKLKINQFESTWSWYRSSQYSISWRRYWSIDYQADCTKVQGPRPRVQDIRSKFQGPGSRFQVPFQGNSPKGISYWRTLDPRDSTVSILLMCFYSFLFDLPWAWTYGERERVCERERIGCLFINVLPTHRGVTSLPVRTTLAVEYCTPHWRSECSATQGQRRT